VDDCWSFNFGNFGSSGNLGNLFSGHAMTALLGDLGDSSLSRLPIYSIAKSAMAIPAILFPAVIPNRRRVRERNPEDLCRIDADAGNSLSRMFQRYQTVGQRLSSPRGHVERRAAQASRLGVETSRGCLRFHAASGNSCKEPGWSRHSCLR
jgi:hypothetical protein